MVGGGRNQLGPLLGRPRSYRGHLKSSVPDAVEFWKLVEWNCRVVRTSGVCLIVVGLWVGGAVRRKHVCSKIQKNY